MACRPAVVKTLLKLPQPRRSPARPPGPGRTWRCPPRPWPHRARTWASAAAGSPLTCESARSSVDKKAGLLCPSVLAPSPLPTRMPFLHTTDALAPGCLFSICICAARRASESAVGNGCSTCDRRSIETGHQLWRYRKDAKQGQRRRPAKKRQAAKTNKHAPLKIKEQSEC